MRAALLPALLCLSLIPACRVFPGHPVRLGAPRLGASPAPSPGTVPEPSAPAGDEAEAALFRGLAGIHEPLRRLRARALPEAHTPTLLRLPRMESAVQRRYARGGFGGAVRSVVVVAALGRVPLAPAAMAELLTDPQVERAVLSADRLWKVEDEFVFQDWSRARYGAALLRRGAGPLRFDLRFTFATERCELSDGRIRLRYDPQERPRPEHVTLFRGGCLLDPEPGGGTRVTEILILGTDLQLLPILHEQMVGLVRKTLEDRCTNLWVRAWAASR